MATIRTDEVEEQLSGKKNQKTNRWQEATRKREGSNCWGNRKRRLPASHWTRNITTSVSLKLWHNLGILSCEEHGVDKNKHRRGKSYPPVFPDHKGLGWGPHIYVRGSTSGLFAPAHWSTLQEGYPADAVMVFSLAGPSLVHNNTWPIITTLYI